MSFRKKIKIADRIIGDGEKCFIIAEVAQAHEGSLGLAHAFIDVAADCGVDAIKFQTHIADAESTLDEPFRVKFSTQDKTRYDYWKRIEFTEEEWTGLAKHSAEKGLVFISSAFSHKALILLDKIGCPVWKIASGEVFADDLVEYMIASKKPILISTGMSEYKQINDRVKTFEKAGSDYAVMQCTSMYPTPMEKIGLNVIGYFKKKFNCPIGLSDHSGTEWPAIYSLANGINILEMHLTMNDAMFGPDVPSSLTPDKFTKVVEARDNFWKMEKGIVDKDALAKELSHYKDIFSKSLSPVEDIEAGTVLKEEMLTFKKPGTGILRSELDKVLGKRLAKDVCANKLLRKEDIIGF